MKNQCLLGSGQNEATVINPNSHFMLKTARQKLMSMFQFMFATLSFSIDKAFSNRYKADSKHSSTLPFSVIYSLKQNAQTIRT